MGWDFVASKGFKGYINICKGYRIYVGLRVICGIYLIYICIYSIYHIVCIYICIIIYLTLYVYNI